MAAHDILWEGLIALITLICFGEHAASLVTDIVLHELESTGEAITEFVKPARIHLRLLTFEQGECVR